MVTCACFAGVSHTDLTLFLFYLFFLFYQKLFDQFQPSNNTKCASVIRRLSIPGPNIPLDEAVFTHSDIQISTTVENPLAHSDSASV